ncbi:MAG: YfhO family protein [Prevotella sp.]|nr:YfhO family protein [Prevotella sp.]
MKKWKLWLPDMVAVVLFAVIAFAYFYPADVENRILFRHDSSAGLGAGQEASEFLKQTGERTRWSNSIFGGMPTYQTAPSYDSTDALQTAVKAYHLWLPENVWYVFAYLLGFYILMRVVLPRKETGDGSQDYIRIALLAFLGAIAWAFSSYFFIIIGAGHLWKVMALAYLPPLIAGIVLAYRGKYLWGLVVTAVFAAFEINANHVQMTYYYLFVIAAMVIAYIIESRKDWRHVLKATGVCMAGALIGVCLNLSNLYHTWEYSQETMRGKSELVKADAANQTSSGLDRDYITQWSYGIDETWTLLIPNAKGGASVPIINDATAMEHADEDVVNFFGQLFEMNPYSNFYEYWGTQPMTAGPVYVGAFVFFLFVLSLFIVKGPMKWALLAVTVLSVMLSWGKNFMPLTDFFLDFVPMYAKFRTVASILVIAEFTIPLLAMMALWKWITTPVSIKYVYISLGLTGGFCLLFALMPGMFFDFNSAVDAQTVDMMNAQIVPMLKDHPDILQQYQAVIGRLLPSLAEMHQAVFTADCWRSLLIILIGVACLLLHRWGKLRAGWLISLLVVLCLVDMWQVDKRYLNDEMFVPKSERENPIKPTFADEQILQDKSLDYRVLNLTTNTFNENETSFFHKSIGGYHAAKLRRYQELIDAYLMPEMQSLFTSLPQVGYDLNQLRTDSVMPVLNMLNTKYLIVGVGNQTVALQNYQTYGNAWLVDKVQYVENANEEIEALGRLSLRHEAVADKKFADVLGQSTLQDTLSLVTLDKYQPNQLTYTVQSGKGGVVVFSEIYYPGWTATVDGEEVELGRVNYVLRALQVKPGRHEVVLSFFPKTVKTTETIAYISYGLLALVIILLIVMSVRKLRP